MMRQRIYIDTSVIGGNYDEEFQEATSELFKRLENIYPHHFIAISPYPADRI